MRGSTCQRTGPAVAQRLDNVQPGDRTDRRGRGP
jgi:hypothetical protein